MKKHLVIISGFIATGKSTLLDYIKTHYNVKAYSKDVYKEKLVKTEGYRSREENKALSIRAVNDIFNAIMEDFKQHALIVAEANFSKDELKRIVQYCKNDDIDTTVIMLTLDEKLLYKRYSTRYSRLHEAHRSIPLLTREVFTRALREYEESISFYVTEVINADEVLDMKKSLDYIFVSND